MNFWKFSRRNFRTHYPYRHWLWCRWHRLALLCQRFCVVCVMFPYYLICLSTVISWPDMLFHLHIFLLCYSCVGEMKIAIEQAHVVNAISVAGRLLMWPMDCLSGLVHHCWPSMSSTVKTLLLINMFWRLVHKHWCISSIVLRHSCWNLLTSACCLYSIC